MPELPDIEVYVAALRRELVGRRLDVSVIYSPFVLRTVSPAPSEIRGRILQSVVRLGKRIVLSFEGGLWLAIHLMVAGRLHWRTVSSGRPRKTDLAALTFGDHRLLLTEASSRRRASIHIGRGEADLRLLDAGGLDVMECTVNQFRRALQRENHTLKRALTDPRILSGIGNAYSDEILHRARMSPFLLTQGLTDEEACRLHIAAVEVLHHWTERLMRQAAGSFPEQVTAFRPEMAVHGRYGKPCPECGRPVQRIVYAEREANYCAECQTEGRLLADRALSRLLKSDWPGTLRELEEVRAERTERR